MIWSSVCRFDTSLYRIINLDRLNDKLTSSLSNVKHFHQSQRLGESVKKNKKMISYVRLDHNYVKDLTQVTGVAVVPFGVGWATFNLKEDNKLTNFNAVLLANEMSGRVYSENQVYNFFKELKKKIPESDLYVLEHFDVRWMFDVEKLFQAQSIAMLTVMLNQSQSDENDRNKVHFHRRNIIDNLYGLRVGRERISPGQKLQQMLNKAFRTHADLTNEKELKISIKGANVTLTSAFLNKLFTWPPVKRDASAHALLLSTSFIYLNAGQQEDETVEESSENVREGALSSSDCLREQAAGSER